MQAYKSMLKRSNQSLRQHLNDSQVAIHVTETTEVVMDDIPPPRAPKSKRRHRKPQEEPAQNMVDGATEDNKP
ncbi:hypothetical protein NUW54_g14043 [Trametes sanguinea]|uniref:Uncharacterized protein n=1 Tax=Trametes sanguinea TaxID=158606 RepID=A0ACC1MFU9_9APHY|nr:hypothetical protein NUW54_g14043 [Trametes sanguinea]